MIKILITAHDTEVGKTRTTAALARALSAQGKSVDVVKAVQSGVPHGGDGDAEWVLANLPADTTVSATTLFNFETPLAPVQAADIAQAPLSFSAILNALKALPTDNDIQLIEGAGGIAVPLEHSGKDYADLARELEVDYIVVVIRNRMGAINQARITLNYAPASIPAGIIFNDLSANESHMVTQSHYETLTKLGINIWGHIKYDSVDVTDLQPFYAEKIHSRI